MRTTTAMMLVGAFAWVLLAGVALASSHDVVGIIALSLAAVYVVIALVTAR